MCCSYIPFSAPTKEHCAQIIKLIFRAKKILKIQLSIHFLKQNRSKVQWITVIYWNIWADNNLTGISMSKRFLNRDPIKVLVEKLRAVKRGSEQQSGGKHFPAARLWSDFDGGACGSRTPRQDECGNLDLCQDRAYAAVPLWPGNNRNTTNKMLWAQQAANKQTVLRMSFTFWGINSFVFLTGVRWEDWHHSVHIWLACSRLV